MLASSRCWHMEQRGGEGISMAVHEASCKQGGVKDTVRELFKGNA